MPRNSNYRGATCDLCARLGIGLDKHDRKSCFIDPACPQYKKHTRDKRLQAVLDAGKTIPEDILKMAPFKPRDTPKDSYNMVSNEDAR